MLLSAEKHPEGSSVPRSRFPIPCSLPRLRARRTACKLGREAEWGRADELGLFRGARMRLRHHLIVVALGASAVAVPAAAPLRAQVVRGVVVEQATRTPVAGVVLSVVDERGGTVAQALSDDDGTFDIRLPRPGAFTLDAKRIGVRRITVPRFVVAEGETHRLDVAVEPLPAVLSSVRIMGHTSCVRHPESNARTAALWDDARAALTAAVLTRRLTSATDTVIRYVRTLDVDTWRVLFEDRRRVPTAAERPFRSLPAEELSAKGYVRVNADSTTDYFAPDAEALLSETFLDDHCFRVKPTDADHAGWVGLSFEPVPHRKTPDIRGVLWLDAKTHELRTVEFTYTWLPYDERTADYGGTVSFFRTPGGQWIVRSWRIRMPEFGHERWVEGFDGQRISLGRTARPHAVRIAEEGGAVPLDVLISGAGRVSGTVVADSVSNRPLPGITVALGGTSDSTVTDANGQFELVWVAPGSYTIVLRHAALDSLGIEHLASTVEVGLGTSVTRVLPFPTYDEIAARLCREPVDFQRQAVIRFVVLDASTGAPLANTPAVLVRRPLHPAPGDSAVFATTLDVTLDEHGAYVACALSDDEAVRLEAPPDAVVAWGQTVRPRPGGLGWYVMKVRARP